MSKGEFERVLKNIYHKTLRERATEVTFNKEDCIVIENALNLVVNILDVKEMICDIEVKE